MNIQPDYEELLRLLEENKVEYLIVGGYAVAFHGYPRFTKNIDIFYRDSERNIANVRRSLTAFGYAESEIPIDLFQHKTNIISFGAEPTRVDLMSDIDGVDFNAAWTAKSRGKYGNVEVNFIGRGELIRNKESPRRLQDKADAEMLSKKF